MENKFFTVDAHQDIAFHLSYFNRDFVDPDIPCMITLPKLKEGNVRLLFNTIFIHPKYKPDKTEKSTEEQFSVYQELYESHDDEIMQIITKSDLALLEENPDKIGFLTLMEGADSIATLDELEKFHELGVRIIGPAWNNKNRYASGNESNDGLSEQGVELIHLMNEYSITLDLSHLNEICFWQSIELTELIPIATHSNARNITNHPRNLYDDQLRAISNRGGVIGIVLYNNFLKTSDKPASLEDVYAHTDYILNLCGEDHVGLGSDMDGARIEDFPEQLRSIADLPKIADCLMSKGYSEELVSKIMGGNFLRVLKENLD